MHSETVLPACLVASIASIIFVNTVASSLDFCADLICWCLLFGGLRAYRYLHPDAPVEHGSSDESNALALAVVLASVCRTLADVNWIIPFVTPAVFLILQRVSNDYLPLNSTDDSSQAKESAQAKTYWEQYQNSPVLLGSIAIVTCATFAPATISWTGTGVACLFLCSQTAIYYLVTARKQQSTDDGLKLIVSSLEPVSYRVAAALAILMMISPQRPSSVSIVGVAAICKAAFWLATVILCRKSHPTTMSSVYTFSIGSVYAHAQAIPWQAFGAAIGSAIALEQTLNLVPRSLLNRKWATGLAIIPILALLSHPVVPHDRFSQIKYNTGLTESLSGRTSGTHPIEELVHHGRARLAEKLNSQSQTLPQAVSEYKRRYGRPPPPYFDVWFAMAVENNVTMIDDYDTIMGSLEPFWGVKPEELRIRTEEAMHKGGSLTKFAIKDGKIKVEHDAANWLSEELKSWLPAFLKYLPDITLAINTLDEPRVVVPNDMLQSTLKHRQKLLGQKSSQEPNPEGIEVNFIDSGKQKVWEILKVGCPVDSPSRTATSRAPPEGIGFVFNATAAKDVCYTPERAGTHGFFTSPSTFQFTHTLVPIFSQAKPSIFQDILYPSPYYTESYDLGKYKEAEDIPWEQKKNKLYWAGSTSGGHSTGGSWQFQHRQKFVALANDRKHLSEFLNETTPGDWTPYNSTMGNLMERFDVKFTSAIQCDEDDCEDERKQFHFGQREKMAEGYASRLIYDIDGNGLSGRFYQLLGSRSAVVKQTLFREWHDDWLIPWVHYIPVSMSLVELPEIVRYLTTTEQGQAFAKEIAEDGQAWSKTVLRKVDIAIVFFRILLEYARIMNDNRAEIQCDC
ncbi:MAG: hypothetical protein M4579_006097 [Chaenotheca gracillima]|nr:MAG: hypothetical protein M4579_006097 [Chaenotheca gracillima]